MFYNYVKIALRQLRKHKLFSALNIFGLATSLSVCLIIIMALRDQYSYDSFHEKGYHIYRVISDKSEKGIPLKDAKYATTALSLGDILVDQYPFIHQAVRMLRITGDVTIGAKRFDSGEAVYLVDQSFLDVFSFGWKAGDRQTALLNPRSVVLTESAAKKFFPDSESLGTATIKIGEFGDFSITGIMPDPPQRSHIRFDFLMSYSTLEQFSDDQRRKAGYYNPDDIDKGLVYVLVNERTKQKSLDQALATQAGLYSERHQTDQYFFQSQTLDDIMPGRDLYNEIGIGTPRKVLYFLMTLGLIIMLSACFNYMNLSIARSIKRSKEIGIRKVTGAGKWDIVGQFMGEAMVISLMAFGVAIIILEFLIPAFFALDPFVGDIFHFDKSFSNYLIFFGFSLLVGFFAGLFPAFNISSYQPLHAIQQLSNIRLFSHVGIRKALITVQFSLSLIFILIVIIVLRQQNHILNVDLGQDIHSVMNVRMQGVDYNVFSQRVAEIDGVEDVSFSGSLMFSGGNKMEMAIYNDGSDSMQLFYNFVSRNFIDNLQIELLAGNNFPEENHSGNEHLVILNEMAIHRMGYLSPEEAIGQFITLDSGSLIIAGVTKDFYHDNIWFSSVQPYALRSRSGQAFNANIRLSAGNIPQTVNAIETTWNELSPGVSMSASFLDEKVYYVARFFRMGSRIIGFVGFLTIVIASMGLLGMVIYTVEGKIKDVGVRKLLGASELNIIWQLSKGFFLLLMIAILFAVPVTVLTADLWLQNFQNRISVNFLMIISGVGIILILGLFTIVSQTWLAARVNPIQTLRSE